MRLNAWDLAPFLARLAFVEMLPAVLERAKDPFPERVRTLDALHLASAGFLREQGLELEFTTYDRRQREAASALGFSLHPDFV